MNRPISTPAALADPLSRGRSSASASALAAGPGYSSVQRYLAHRELILLIVPCLLYFLVFRYVPMVGLIIAFKDYVMSEGVLHSPWVGLDNFAKLFHTSDFPRAIRNTVVISLLRLSFGFVAPIVLALLLNEVRIAWFRRGIQTLTYLPYFFSWVVLGGIFLMIFRGDGPINSLITSAGHSPVSFLGDGVWFVFVLIVTGIWQGAGYGAVIYLAALAGISPSLYEAASIDGANRWQQTWCVTIPSLMPTIVVLFVLNLGSILDAGFDQIYNMYNPIVYDVADIVDTYVLRRMVAMDFSVATAAGVFKSVVGLAMVLGANWWARRMSNGEYGIW